MAVCVPCRDVSAADPCVKCGEATVRAPYKWSPPRKNNDRAWKRIAKGEWLWDRRRVYRAKKHTRDTYTTYETRRVEVPHDCAEPYCSWHHEFSGLVRIERVPGSAREVIDYRRSPDVDMGS